MNPSFGTGLFVGALAGTAAQLLAHYLVSQGDNGSGSHLQLVLRAEPLAILGIALLLGLASFISVLVRHGWEAIVEGGWPKIATWAVLIATALGALTGSTIEQFGSEYWAFGVVVLGIVGLVCSIPLILVMVIPIALSARRRRYRPMG